MGKKLSKAKRFAAAIKGIPTELDHAMCVPQGLLAGARALAEIAARDHSDQNDAIQHCIDAANEKLNTIVELAYRACRVRKEAANG